MASPLSAVLRGEVRRLLKDHGYEPGGQTFRKVGADELIGIIEMGTPNKPPVHDIDTYLFAVQFGVWVPKARPWLSADLQAEVAAARRCFSEAQTQAVLRPTAQSAWKRLAGSGIHHDLWALHAQESPEAVQQDLRGALADIVIPAIDHQLDARQDPFAGPGANERVLVLHVWPPFKPTVGYLKGPPTGRGMWSNETWDRE